MNYIKVAVTQLIPEGKMIDHLQWYSNELKIRRLTDRVNLYTKLAAGRDQTLIHEYQLFGGPCL